MMPLRMACSVCRSAEIRYRYSPGATGRFRPVASIPRVDVLPEGIPPGMNLLHQPAGEIENPDFHRHRRGHPQELVGNDGGIVEAVAVRR